MKKGGGSESTIIVGPSKSVLVYALHSLEYVLGLTRCSGVCAKIIIIIGVYSRPSFHKKNLFKKLNS